MVAFGGRLIRAQPTRPAYRSRFEQPLDCAAARTRPSVAVTLGGRRLAAALLVVVVVTGCSGQQNPSPSPSSKPRTVIGELFARIGPNGEIDKQLALDAFSVAIAPLPGVTV